MSELNISVLKSFISTLGFGVITPEIIALLSVIVFTTFITWDKKKYATMMFPMAIIMQFLGFYQFPIIMILFGIWFIWERWNEEGFKDMINTTNNEE